MSFDQSLNWGFAIGSFVAGLFSLLAARKVHRYQKEIQSLNVSHDKEMEEIRKAHLEMMDELRRKHERELEIRKKHLERELYTDNQVATLNFDLFKKILSTSFHLVKSVECLYLPHENIQGPGNTPFL